MSAAPAKRRCAVYTRKSSDEGLEQDFNSLHAQREACEAYIRSQAGEGWMLIANAYDDGGISGGTLDRPALRRLLQDIKAGLIDAVVVYKVDRLTRSLTDFAKIVETFDSNGVSFVSITQAFNTTTSMGRLTLNVLLSFAQFEREVTGERIRDKIAQSKAKGMWMAGVVPLGYDVEDRKLVINQVEAEKVRYIFERYCALRSVHALRAELQRNGVRSKAWTTRAGRAKGGAEFSNGALYHLLRNRHYLGKIVHKGVVHPGLHSPIVPEALYDRAAAILGANGVIRRKTRDTQRGVAPLKGLVFDGAGRPLTPSFSRGKTRKVYRYYVSHTGDEASKRLPAVELESVVFAQLERFTIVAAASPDALKSVERVEVREDGLELVLGTTKLPRGDLPDLALQLIRDRLFSGEMAMFDGDTVGRIRIKIVSRIRKRGGRKWLLGVVPEPGVNREKTTDNTLVKALRRAHGFLTEVNGSPLEPEPFSAAVAPNTTYGARLAKLAFLAPDIQLDILTGRQPKGLHVKALLEADIPISWEQQRTWLRSFVLKPIRAHARET